MSRSPEQYWQRARQYLFQGQSVAARAQLEALRIMAPNDARTHLLATRIAKHEDRIRDAAQSALSAAATVPNSPELLCDTVEELLSVGEVVAARECLSHPVLADTTAVRWLLRLADYRQRLDEHDHSLEFIERALKGGANGADIHFHYGIQLYFHGRIAEASSELESSLQLAPSFGRAAVALARLRVWDEKHNHLEALAQGLEHVAKGTRDHAALLFARYEELEDLGRYEEAWQALSEGNRVMRMRNPYDATNQRGYLDHLMAAPSAHHATAHEATQEGPQPIFIIGMARSGTTVLERMLGSHSSVTSAGELTDFGNQLCWEADTSNTQGEEFTQCLPTLDVACIGHRYLAQTQWRAQGKPFFIDKQPSNWALAGLIHAALPRAPIVRVVRDGMDVCFSNWRAFFGDTYAYSYDMASLASHHHDYERVMAHWHTVMPDAILDVSYNDLVRAPEAVMRKVFAFCELEPEPGCTDMQRNLAPVATLSAAQVRQPLHSASGEWRRYARQLAPLRDALEQA